MFVYSAKEDGKKENRLKRDEKELREKYDLKGFLYIIPVCQILGNIIHKDFSP